MSDTTASDNRTVICWIKIKLSYFACVKERIKARQHLAVFSLVFLLISHFVLHPPLYSMNNGNADRSSVFQLPHDILCLIISLLTIREVIALRTCSKRAYLFFESIQEQLSRVIMGRFHALFPPVTDWDQESCYVHPSTYGTWVMENYSGIIRQHWNPDALRKSRIRSSSEAKDEDSSEDIPHDANVKFPVSHFHDRTQMKVFRVALRNAKLITSQPTSPIFTKECARMLAVCCLNAAKAQCHSRLISYNAMAGGHTSHLLAVHSVSHAFLQQQDLNEYEKKLFRFFDNTHCDVPAPKYICSSLVVCTELQFRARMDRMFAFSLWRLLIDWKSFFLVGGSALRALMQIPFEASAQDLDFFYCGNDYYEYVDAICKFTYSVDEQLSAHYVITRSDEEIANSYVRTVVLSPRSQTLYGSLPTLTMQFIWYGNLVRSAILSIFDLDCCQVWAHACTC